eukprot:UN21152
MLTPPDIPVMGLDCSVATAYLDECASEVLPDYTCNEVTVTCAGGFYYQAEGI